MNFSIIVAANNKHGIGLNGNLLYKSQKDMEYFKNITTTVINNCKKNCVIMGRRTWESIPAKFRPLPKRINIILSENNTEKLIEETKDFKDSVLISKNLNSALNTLKDLEIVENIFIIGGERLYTEAINNKYCQYIYYTNINRNDSSDTFFPCINEKNFELISNTELIDTNGILISTNEKFELKLNFKVYKSILTNI